MGSLVFLRLTLIDALEMSRAWAYFLIWYYHIFQCYRYRYIKLRYFSSIMNKRFFCLTYCHFLHRSYPIRPCCIDGCNLFNFAFYLAHNICIVILKGNYKITFSFAMLHERLHFYKVQKLCFSTRWVMRARLFVIFIH